MNAVSNIQTKVIQCKIESVKMYLLPGTDEYTDKTPILELTFKPIAGTGAIKQKIVLTKERFEQVEKEFNNTTNGNYPD